jgi:hypothetical protein
MHDHSRILLFLAGAGLAACGGVSEQPAVSNTFEVTATLSFADDPPQFLPDPGNYPDIEDYVLRLDDALDGTVDAIWSSYDGKVTSVFDRGDEGLQLREPLRIDLDLGDYSDIGRSHIEYASIRLTLEDRDGDGNADRVTGRGRGVLRYNLGDVPQEDEFTVRITGTPDVTPPELHVVGDDTSLHVLDGLRITASEPLLPGSTARAWYGDDFIDLTPPAGAEYVTAFTSKDVLPFGVELRIEIDPVPQDLVGLAAVDVPTTAKTMPDPGLFAADGFEADPVAMLGSADVVTGVGTLPAITGARSLLIEPGETLTMRIPVPVGATHLRLRARSLADRNSGGCDGSGIRVGAAGVGILAERFVTSGGDGPDEGIADSDWVSASPVYDMELALPSGVSGELVFDVFGLPLVQPPCGQNALLIDDLRAE